MIFTLLSQTSCCFAEIAYGREPADISFMQAGPQPVGDLRCRVEDVDEIIVRLLQRSTQQGDLALEAGEFLRLGFGAVQSMAEEDDGAGIERLDPLDVGELQGPPKGED